jgi:signal transduction histidine kinase
MAMSFRNQSVDRAESFGESADNADEQRQAYTEPGPATPHVPSGKRASDTAPDAPEAPDAHDVGTLHWRARGRTAGRRRTDLFPHDQVRLERAVAGERVRMATEFHDSIGASLAAIKYGAEFALQQLKSGDHAQALTMLNDVVGGLAATLKDMRQIEEAVHEPPRRTMPTVARIYMRCSFFETLHPDIRLVREFDIRETDITPDVGEQLFLILKEAMANAVKHGKPAHLQVSLRRTHDCLHLVVEDDGGGFEPDAVAQAGLGLNSMRQRALQSGGTLNIESIPGRGTRIDAKWRCPPPEAGAR